MAWKLLTDVYGIPSQNLFVTYFGGDKELGLDPDEECREIWMHIGLVSMTCLRLIGVKNALPIASKSRSMRDCDVILVCHMFLFEDFRAINL